MFVELEPTPLQTPRTLQKEDSINLLEENKITHRI
jgi:hypothetical protein